MCAYRQEARWVPPLPHGWEAKFDQGQRTYFFINHQTKTTQWEDPRFTRPAAAAPSQQPAAAAESNLSSQGNNAVVSKLQGEFPAATRELIADMLSNSHNSEHQTRRQLQDLGFGANSATSGAGRATSPSRRAGSQRGASAVSPSRATPAVAAASPKREVSEAEKTQIVNQFKREFPNTDPDVIRIALEACNFDRQKGKELVLAWEKRQKDENERNARIAAVVGGSSGGSSGGSQAAGPSQQSLLPAGLTDDVPRARPAGSHRTTISVGDGARSSPARYAQLAQAPRINRGSHGEGASGSQPQHARAQQVTRPRHKKTRQTAAVVTSQPRTTPGRSEVTNENRTAANGPDRDLHRGPDTSLLATEYSQAEGPNRELRHGPSRGLVEGPQGCQGPDFTLRCGPQCANLATGGLDGQRESVVTPSGVLITAI